MSLPGASGEDRACRFLEDADFVILARNWRCRGGELDIVARDGRVTVFVEVKERGSDSHGEGWESVTALKRRRIIRAAQLWASGHGLSEAPLRFDVVSIDHGRDGRTRIRHEKGAFDVEGN